MIVSRWYLAEDISTRTLTVTNVGKEANMSNYDQNTAASGAAKTDVATIDAGLRAYMLNIYNHMSAGVGLTAVIAWLTYQFTGPELLQSPLMWVFILAPLVLVFFISARINTLSVSTARSLFFIYAALVGVSLSILFHIYTNSSITRVFFITAATFGALSLFGYTTRRDLSGFAVEYLFLDAIYESLRLQGGGAEGLLCAWGILADGRKALLHLTLGNKESYRCWLGMLRDLVRRGLRPPVSITSDGAPGLLRAITETWPKSLRLRCWVHRMRNVLDKVPDAARAEVKAHLVAIRDAPTYETGRQTALAVLARFERAYPTAMASLREDLEASLAHLRLPAAHRKYVRTTNLIERSFLEERRRTKIIPRFFDERSCLKLVYATLVRASQRWQRIRVTDAERTHLLRLRQELGLPFHRESVFMKRNTTKRLRKRMVA